MYTWQHMIGWNNNIQLWKIKSKSLRGKQKNTIFHSSGPFVSVGVAILWTLTLIFWDLRFDLWVFSQIWASIWNPLQASINGGEFVPFFCVFFSMFICPFLITSRCFSSWRRFAAFISYLSTLISGMYINRFVIKYSEICCISMIFEHFDDRFDLVVQPIYVLLVLLLLIFRFIEFTRPLRDGYLLNVKFLLLDPMVLIYVISAIVEAMTLCCNFDWLGLGGMNSPWIH